MQLDGMKIGAGRHQVYGIISDDISMRILRVESSLAGEEIDRQGTLDSGCPPGGQARVRVKQVRVRSVCPKNQVSS